MLLESIANNLVRKEGRGSVLLCRSGGREERWVHLGFCSGRRLNTTQSAERSVFREVSDAGDPVGRVSYSQFVSV